MRHVPVWIKNNKSLFQLDMYDLRYMETSIERKLVDDGAETGSCVGNYYIDNLKTSTKVQGKKSDEAAAKKEG